jgi:hypothetical protein
MIYWIIGSIISAVIIAIIVINKRPRELKSTNQLMKEVLEKYRKRHERKK